MLETVVKMQFVALMEETMEKAIGSLDQWRLLTWSANVPTSGRNLTVLALSTAGSFLRAPAALRVDRPSTSRL